MSKSEDMLSHSLILFDWTHVKYLQWYQRVTLLGNVCVCVHPCLCVWWIYKLWSFAIFYICLLFIVHLWNFFSALLTERFACPLSFAISKTHTLQHVGTGVMRPLPSVPDFIRPPTIVASICEWQNVNLLISKTSCICEMAHIYKFWFNN